MKKDFFEIMKNYNPEIKSFSVSSENIKEKAMCKINKPKKRFHFTKRISPAIAAAAVCLTAGAGVIAYELSTLDRAVQFYEEHPYASQTIDEKDKEVLTDLLKAETAIVESNGATMELTGSMYDENKMLLFFKFTAPDDIVLSQEEYTFEDWMFHHNSDSTGGAGSELYFNDTDRTDNITYFTYEIDCDGFKAQEFTDIHFENLCLLASPDKKTFFGDIVFKGEWIIPLNLSTPSESVHLLDESIKIYNPERYYRVYDIKISSLTLWIEASYEITNVDISVIMKDGSIINEVMGGGRGNAGSENGFSNIYSFGKPINLSEVKSIKLNDTEISVEDKYAEKYGNVTAATEPDTTSMTEIYAGSSYIPTTETEDIVRLKSIKIDNENIAIALTSNAVQDTMTIITKDNQTELIPFGNGTDADGDGIYTEIHKLRNEYNPEDIVFIDIENAGVRLEVAEYMKEKYENVKEATEPDTTGMREIFAEKINIFATDDIILLDSIKMDHEKLIIALTSNTLQDTMTIYMKDKTKSEKILFGNGIDTNGDGIYTESYQFEKPLNPEDVDYIEIENTGLRLEVSAYMNNN